MGREAWKNMNKTHVLHSCIGCMEAGSQTAVWTRSCKALISTSYRVSKSEKAIWTRKVIYILVLEKFLVAKCVFPSGPLGLGDWDTHGRNGRTFLYSSSWQQGWPSGAAGLILVCSDCRNACACSKLLQLKSQFGLVKAQIAHGCSQYKKKNARKKKKKTEKSPSSAQVPRTHLAVLASGKLQLSKNYINTI